MRVEEFRIGNYYKWYADSKEYYFKVDNSFFGDINVINNAEPIELTEEILLKCGFKHTGNGFYEILGKFFELCNIGNEFFNTGFKGVSIGKINFLHQLQNLYFALTNEELNAHL